MSTMNFIFSLDDQGERHLMLTQQENAEEALKHGENIGLEGQAFVTIDLDSSEIDEETREGLELIKKFCEIDEFESSLLFLLLKFAEMTSTDKKVTISIPEIK